MFKYVFLIYRNINFEYSITESNKITTSNYEKQVAMENCPVTCTENLLEFTRPYKNKIVTVHLEFPKQQNQEAADDFISRLKELYLKKIKIQSSQGENPALYSQPTKGEEKKANA